MCEPVDERLHASRLHAVVHVPSLPAVGDQTGILAKPDVNLETLVRQRAEEEILRAAIEDGILEQARLNAEAYLFKFFAALGYPNTIFVDDQG